MSLYAQYSTLLDEVLDELIADGALPADLDALIAAGLAQHYRLDGRQVLSALFPETRGTVLRQQLTA